MSDSPSFLNTPHHFCCDPELLNLITVLRDGNINSDGYLWLRGCDSYININRVLNLVIEDNVTNPIEGTFD